MIDSLIIDGDSPEVIGAYVRANQIKNIILVRGNSSFEKSGASKYISSLIKSVTIHEIIKENENPTTKKIVKTLQNLSEINFEMIIAIGGGAVIDIAKLIKAYHGTDPSKVITLIKNNKTQVNSNIPLLVIPTTSGSGSESTHFAVVYDGKKKFSVADELLLPEIVVLDYKLTMSCNYWTTISSASDALCQAIESYFSVKANSKSKLYSKMSLLLIFKELDNLLNNRISEFTRSNLQQAAFYAGKAINISKTNAAHAMSYGLTSYYKIPHGIAVLINLAEIINRINLSNSILDIDAFISANTIFETTEKCISHFRNSILRRHEFSTYIKKNLKNVDYNLLAGNVNTERLSNYPVKLNNQDILNIYKVSISNIIE